MEGPAKYLRTKLRPPFSRIRLQPTDEEQQENVPPPVASSSRRSNDGTRARDAPIVPIQNRIQPRVRGQANTRSPIAAALVSHPIRRPTARAVKCPSGKAATSLRPRPVLSRAVLSKQTSAAGRVSSRSESVQRSEQKSIQKNVKINRFQLDQKDVIMHDVEKLLMSNRQQSEQLLVRGEREYSIE